jgi:dTDP-4-dehydrorhamnose 3,5-epimerase
MDLKNISSQYHPQITTQDYGKKDIIDGVKIVDLKMFYDEGGDFTELGRIKNGALEAFPQFKIKQINISTMMPHSVKAFHLHLKQADVWYVPPASRLLVGLKDLRKESPTKDLSMRLTLGGHTSKLLYVPQGVAHGAGNLWPQPASVIYFVDQYFNPQDPDELRLPANLLGEDFWQLRKE